MANLRKLGRRTDHRTAMLRNLVQSLFENGKIETTVTRAKEARREAEYTRILKLGPRRGDGYEMCILELVDYTKKESSNEKETVKADK